MLWLCSLLLSIFLLHWDQEDWETWWCHDMEKFSTLLALCEENPPNSVQCDIVDSLKTKGRQFDNFVIIRAP